MKDIFQRPADEDDWHKLELFRRTLLRIAEGEDWLLVQGPEEASAIAASVQGCANGKFPDEVGPGCRIPEGARLQVGSLTSQEDVASAVTAIGAGDDKWLCYLSRPFGTKRAPLVDSFCRSLFGDQTAEKIADGMLAPAFLDKMLLCLFDALWLQQSEEWSKRGVANMPSDEAYEIANWFLKGQSVGKKPLFDGICSQCGTLLYGTLGHHSALSNKYSGEPMDRDGLVLYNDDGTPQTSSQPPFLLRYSPQLFATEAPEVFAHDPDTNCLYLKEGKKEPWRRDMERARAEKSKTWLYCIDCHARFFATGKRVFGHIPYRDRASQSSMRRPADKEVVETQEEPEREPAANDTPPDGEEQEAVLPLLESLCEEMEEEQEDEIGDALAEEDAPDPLDRTWPTLDEYKAKWERLTVYHSRTNPGDFSRHNLVPEPIPQLWEDCPTADGLN